MSFTHKKLTLAHCIFFMVTIKPCNMARIQDLPDDIVHTITLFSLDIESSDRRALCTSIRHRKIEKLTDSIPMSSDSRNMIFDTVERGGTLDNFIDDVIYARTSSSPNVFSIRIGPRIRLRSVLEKLRGQI